VTRSEYEKHDAARKVAVEVEAKVNHARVAIEERAKYLRDSGLQEADEKFGAKPGRTQIESELRQWLKSLKGPEVLSTIKKVMRENPEVASVLWHSPRHLLGFSSNNKDADEQSRDIFEELRYEALEVHYPKTYQKFSDAANLEKVAERYKATLKRIHPSFYNPMLADQGKKRVAM
jgi:hypothetical protein